MLRPYHVPPRLPRCPGCRCEAQNAARPRVPFGRPAMGPSAGRCPSACTRNAWIACSPPVCSTYRYVLLWLSAMSLMPAPINAVPPFASTRPIAPSGAIANADTEPAPLPVKPMRPSLVTTAQHGAPWCVRTAPLTSVRPSASSYELDATDGLSLVSGAVLTHQGAPCWAVVTNDGRIGFTGNGAGSVSAFTIAPDGAISLVDANGGTALIGAGINDIALSHNSRYLYVLQTGGAQAIHRVRVQADGHLTALGPIAGLPNGTRGLAAF